MATRPEYLPDLEYFTFLLESKYILFADHIQYSKRSPITRSTNLANGIFLSVPVIHNGYKKSISEKHIAFIESWPGKHLKTIHHLYNKRPFFEEYYFEYKTLYESIPIQLNRFLLNSTQFFLDKLKIKSQLISTTKMGFTTDFELDIVNFAETYKLRKYYYKRSDKAFIKTEKLNGSNIQSIEFSYKKNNRYLSMNILEFLFNFGPEAAFLMRE